jgi:hypothetical protein
MKVERLFFVVCVGIALFMACFAMVFGLLAIDPSVGHTYSIICGQKLQVAGVTSVAGWIVSGMYAHMAYEIVNN